jgi:hypothetical protein
VTSSVLTPTLRATGKRWVFWVIAGVVALVIAFGALAIAGSSAVGRAYDPESPAPNGTMAVVEVLRQQGVQVIVTHSLAATRAAVATGAETTLVIDDDGYLDDEQLTAATELARTVIVLDPDFVMIDALAPEVAQAGSVTGTADADCDLGAVTRAGRVTIDGVGYRIIDEAANAVTCLGSDDDVYSLVGLDRGDTMLWFLGALDALTNERITEEGNAAFGLGLLGEHDRLVWYIPSIDDLPPGGTIAELTPDWVTPVMVILALTAIAAAVWRGRRMGPLVVENLPVTVRASETMQGRARLYARSSARLRALDALRVGTIQRLAVRCGLPSTATVDEVVLAAAALTGRAAGEVHQLLVDAQPGTDRELVDLSDALLTLERDIESRLAP